MILFIILSLIILILLVIAIGSFSVIGAGAILIFGDVFVCIAIIVGIIVFLAKRKK